MRLLPEFTQSLSTVLLLGCPRPLFFSLDNPLVCDCLSLGWTDKHASRERHRQRLDSLVLLFTSHNHGCRPLLKESRSLSTGAMVHTPKRSGCVPAPLGVEKPHHVVVHLELDLLRLLGERAERIGRAAAFLVMSLAVVAADAAAVAVVVVAGRRRATVFAKDVQPVVVRKHGRREVARDHHRQVVHASGHYKITRTH